MTFPTSHDPVILTLDPGITTGYCVIFGGQAVEVGMIPLVDLEASRVWRVFNVYKVYVETVPIVGRGKLARDLEYVNRAIAERFRRIFPVYVLPGTWKPRFEKKVRQFKMLSGHEQDALGIGLYYEEVKCISIECLLLN